MKKRDEDSFTALGAGRIALSIQEFWRQQGLRDAAAWIEPIELTDDMGITPKRRMFQVRSNVGLLMS